MSIQCRQSAITLILTSCIWHLSRTSLPQSQQAAASLPPPPLARIGSAWLLGRDAGSQLKGRRTSAGMARRQGDIKSLKTREMEQRRKRWSTDERDGAKKTTRREGHTGSSGSPQSAHGLPPRQPSSEARPEPAPKRPWRPMAAACVCLPSSAHARRQVERVARLRQRA
jgi:hypothetical protein